MMTRPVELPLPEYALLATYRAQGAYTDCFVVEVPGIISQAQFVEAFYTSWLFKVERMVLKYAVAKPSTDAQAVALAAGSRNDFAAWHLEARRPDQLLMCDYQGRTRSWLMVTPLEGPVTRLSFGSAVVAVRRRLGKKKMPMAFHVLLSIHRLYAKALLRAAVGQLG
jgi:hypothetical protein